MKTFSVFLICLLMAFPSYAEKVSVAVAGNFTAPMKKIISAFEAHTGHQVVASYASSGKLFAQIINGAPYEVFLSADQSKPYKLVSSNQAVEDSLFTYAKGTIVLWSSQSNLIEGFNTLSSPNIKHLAIANPKLAPYGQAAMETIASLGLTEQLKHKLVQAENIAQAYQFVASGNAELGFVALSQIVKEENRQAGSSWTVPSNYHSPINQDAVLLNKGKDNLAAHALLNYLKTEEAAMIIRSYGYQM